MKKTLVFLGIFVLILTIVLRPASKAAADITTYSVTISPGSVKVTQGDTALYHGMVIQSIHGVESSNLKLIGAPPGSEVWFVPPGTPYSNKFYYEYLLWISIPYEAASKTYDITVEATWFALDVNTGERTTMAQDTVSAQLVVLPGNENEWVAEPFP